MWDTLINVMNGLLYYYRMYCSNSLIMVLYIVSLGFISLTNKENRKKIVYPSLLMMAVVFNPIFYVYIFGKLLGATYWRIMWMIPVIPVIAVAVVEFCKSRILFRGRVFSVVALGLLVVILGSNIYTEKKQFEKATNWYKLPQPVIDVVDEVLDLSEEPNCLVWDDLYCYTRQYRTGFKQLFGRNAEGFISPFLEGGQTIRAYPSCRNGEVSHRLLMYAREELCNIVIGDLTPNNHDVITSHEYKQAASIQNKGIYIRKNERLDVAKWFIRQRGYEDLSNRMGYVLESNDGKLIIVDGGYSQGDTWMESPYIEQHDNVVDTWILSSIDPGHTGVFLDYYNNPNVTLKRILIPRYDKSYGDENNKEYYEYFYNLVKDDERIEWCDKDDTKKICGLKFNVVSIVGNTMCFCVSGNEDTFLFGSDVVDGMVEDLKKLAEKQSIDYMQVAIHENVRMPVGMIAEINPKQLLFDCAPKKLDALPGETQKGIQTIENKGYSDIYYIRTLPNTIIFY